METQEQYTPEQIAQYLAEIDNLEHEEMARIWRFAKSGHPYLRSDTPMASHFLNRFKQLGGWTSELSKKIGWESS